MKSLLLHSRSLLVMAMVTCFSLAARGDMPSELLNHITSRPECGRRSTPSSCSRAHWRNAYRGPPPLGTRMVCGAVDAPRYDRNGFGRGPGTATRETALGSGDPGCNCRSDCRSIADKLGGVVDTIADRPAVETP